MTKSLQDEIVSKAKASTFFLDRSVSLTHHLLTYRICRATFVSNRVKTLKAVIVLKSKAKDMMVKSQDTEVGKFDLFRLITQIFQLKSKIIGYYSIWGKKGHNAYKTLSCKAITLSYDTSGYYSVSPK